MIRSELVRRLVLNSICDDFENIDQVILPEVAEAGAKCGLTIERSEVVETLAGLIENGLAKAYVLRGSGDDPFSDELKGMPPMDAVEQDFETYFYITKKGMDLHLSGVAWWPLDDEGKLR
jgi:hypothetical protein